MNRHVKTVGIVAAAGGIIYYLYHRHEAAASNALAQDIANGTTPTMNTAAPLSETGGNTGAMAPDPYAPPNTPTYGTGAVGNGTPSAPNTQPTVRTVMPTSTPQPVGPAKNVALPPGQSPPGQSPPIIGRLPASTPQPAPSPKILVSTPTHQTPPIVALPNSKVTTYMKG